MLSIIRDHLGNWYAKALFIILAISFAGWGVGDMLTNGASDSAVAHVAGQKIEPAQVQNAYETELGQLSARLPRGQEPTAPMRRLVAEQVVERLITTAALNAEVARMGLRAPDAAIRDTVFAMPAFRGTDGKFDRARFDQLLAQNGLTEQHFLALVRQQIGQEQLLGAVGAGALAPPDLTAALFAFQNETRTAEAVFLPFSAAPTPPPPTDAALQRWWANHPKTYSTPEYRRVRLAILSPDVVAKTVKISEASLRAAYAQAKPQYDKPERRSAEILLAPSESTAAALVARWQSGGTWAEMKEAAKGLGATPIALRDALPVEFPDAELARAIFAASPDTVIGPLKTALGWHVVKVVAIVPGENTTFADAKPALEAKLAREEAVNLVDTRVTSFEDAVAANPGLEGMPGDIGLVGLTGTLDSAGITPDGQPAPIPGPAALRKAIIAAAFSARKGDIANVERGPGNSYYALDIETIIPPHVQPYAMVKARVRADWTLHQQKHEQDVAATHLMLAVNGGTPLVEAARGVGLTAKELPPTRRGTPSGGVPKELLGPLFQLSLHRATMVETSAGFVTAELVGIDDPSKETDPTGYRLMQQQLARSIGQDLQQSFIEGARTRAHPRINIAMLDKIAQP